MRSFRLLWLLFLLAVAAVGQTVTPNIGLYEPSVNQRNWGTQVNQNWVIIDNLMGGVTAVPSMKILGTLTLANITGTTQCLHVNAAGVVSGTGIDCGSGGGGGAVASVFGRTGVVVAQTADYNIAQITNGVSTAGSYSDPSWIVALAWSKLTGVPTVNGHSLTSNVTVTASDVGAWDLTTHNAIGANYFDITGISAPGNPAASNYRYYSKTGTGLCQKDSSGTETCFSSGAGGSVSSVSGDGVLITNSGSTSAVTLTLGNAAAHLVWGNNTGGTTTPSYVRLACADLSNGSASCSTDTTNASNISSGTLSNSRLSAIPNGTLANSSLTLNGQTVSLGATGNIPFQTNTVNNASLNGVNFTTSTTNSVGLTVTPVNSSTIVEKFEVTGASYTGNAATATALAALPTPCSAGFAATGVLANGNSTGCFAPLSNPMTTIGDMIGAGASGVPTRIIAGLTGQSIVATNSASPAFASPGITGRTATLATDAILCDSGTALQDRGGLITYNRGTAITVTVPDAGSAGCGSNFFFGVQNLGAGLVTFNHTTSSTFTTYTGSGAPAVGNSFTLAQGQFGIINSGDNSNYTVRETTGGGGGGGVTSFTGDSNLISNSASTGAVTVTLANAAAHKYWGNPTGSTAAPGYNSIVAGDLPSTLTSGTAITNAVLTTPNIGTPSAGTLTNATGLPISTGVSGLGTGITTFLATPSSANLAAALTDETGSGKAMFATDPLFSAYYDATETAAPANPAASTDRVYFDSTTHVMTCLTSSGGNCMPSSGGGSGTVNSGTSGHYSYYASSTNAVSSNSNLDDGATTANTLTYGGSAGIVAAALATNGSAAGLLTLTGSSSGSAGISVAAAAGTPSTWLMPTTDPTNGQVLQAGTPSGSKVQLSWASGGGTGTVTSVSGTSPITGTVTTTGSLACATCVTSAASLTNNAVVIGGGSQATSTISADTTTTHVLAATAGAPAFRALVAGDLPTALSSSTSVNGTGIPASTTLYSMATPVAGGIGYGVTTSQYGTTAAGTAKQIVLSGGTSAPTFTDFPDLKIIPAANCINGTAGGGWSSTSTGFTATCRAGSNNFNGVLNATPNTGGTAYLDFELPGDWDSASLPWLQVYYASGANTSGTVIWTISHACTKNDGSVTDDPAWIAESAMGTQTMAAANRMWAQNAQFSGSMTNCVAGGTMYLKMVLSGTASSAIQVSKATVTVNRLLVSQAN